MFECKKKRVCCTRGRQKEKGKGFLLKAQQHLVLCLDLLFVHCRTWSRKVHRHKEYKQKIMANYQPLHRELYAMHAENFFVPSFLRAISENTEESFRSMIIEPSQGVYIFEMLQPRFCELLFDEVENFERWVHDTKFRIMRPNTMNKYGAVLDDFGMESMLDKLMNEFIRPMSKGLVNYRAAVPLRLVGSPEFKIEVRARLRLNSYECEQIKIVHVRAVRPGAYDLQDIRLYFE